jgi:hypothetical protein
VTEVLIAKLRGDDVGALLAHFLPGFQARVWACCWPAEGVTVGWDIGEAVDIVQRMACTSWEASRALVRSSTLLCALVAAAGRELDRAPAPPSPTRSERQHAEDAERSQCSDSDASAEDAEELSCGAELLRLLCDLGSTAEGRTALVDAGAVGTLVRVLHRLLQARETSQASRVRNVQRRRATRGIGWRSREWQQKERNVYAWLPPREVSGLAASRVVCLPERQLHSLAHCTHRRATHTTSRATTAPAPASPPRWQRCEGCCCRHSRRIRRMRRSSCMRWITPSR